MLGKHLLSAGDLDRAQALMILDTTAELASVTERFGEEVANPSGSYGREPLLRGFDAHSTVFELAAKRLSADVITFSAKGSSVSKGESLKDTALTLEAMGADAVIVRHGASGAPYRLAAAGWIDCSVINAGDGTHEHPTQALLDAYTFALPHLWGTGGSAGSPRGHRGRCLHSRVARSNVLLLHTLGAEVTLVAPPTLIPVGVESWPCSVSYHPTTH